MTKHAKNKQLKQVQNQAQDGRSMVEMLGVLAIIGVLSIGGIVGYRLAMNHYQASQIAHEMNMMRTDAQIKIAQGTEELTLGEPYDNGTIRFNDYPTDFGFIDSIADPENPEEETAEDYYIEVSAIPQGVCNPLATLLNGMDGKTALKVNDNDYDATANLCNPEGNRLSVSFAAENINDESFAEGRCENNDDCGGGYCQNHICVECKESNDCGEFEVCDQQEGICTTDCSKGGCREDLKCDSQTNRCVECRNIDDCNGLACKNNQCATCSSEADCEGKHCLNGTCVECRTGTDCAGGKGCLSNNTCGACTDDSQCASNHCLNGTCVECVSSTDCADGKGCLNDNTCGNCTDNSQCAGNNCQDGTCKNCSTSADCTNNRACENGMCYDSCAEHESGCENGTHCDTADTQKCVSNCQSSAECDDLQVCNEKSGICEENCTAEGAMECKNGYHCNSTTQKCVSNCQSSEECDNSKVCNEETGVCENDCTAQGAMECKNGYHCNETSKKCVKNCTAADCLGSTPICDATTHECRACTQESDCTALGKHCDTSTGKATSGTCVACTGSTPKWNGTQCVACLSNSDCPTGKTCNQNVCEAIEFGPACSSGYNDTNSRAKVHFSDLTLVDGGKSATVTCKISDSNGGIAFSKKISVSGWEGNITLEELKSMDWSAIKEYCVKNIQDGNPIACGNGASSCSEDGICTCVGNMTDTDYSGTYSEEPFAHYGECTKPS